MQIKSIKKTIQAKLDDWLESITDKSLRDAVKDHLLVSGGSITSLFLGEPVNDYDIYLQNRSVLLRLVKYYTNGHNDVSILDGEFRQQYIDEYKGRFSDHDFAKHQGKRASALRNLREDQVKIYIEGSNGGLKVDINPEKKYQVSFFSPNAISLTDDIQIVIRFHGKPEDIHKTFDFVHATNYFTYAAGVVTNLAAAESILTKQLKYQGSLYPLTSVIRSKKFVKRNWNINAGELLKMMFQISMLDLTDMDTLEEQLIGVDVAYFETLIKALRGKQENEPEFKITPEYFNALIDKIFNDLD